jgi:hypothetical protein
LISSLNLSLGDFYPVQFITALSPARFKAGRYSRDNQYLDLMIDIHKENVLKTDTGDLSGIREPKHGQVPNSEDKPVRAGQLSFLIDQLIHYLSIIKTN